MTIVLGYLAFQVTMEVQLRAMYSILWLLCKRPCSFGASSGPKEVGLWTLATFGATMTSGSEETFGKDPSRNVEGMRAVK